jgi:hypothetical protein
MKVTGRNRSTLGKTCLSATLSTTNTTWTDLGSNPGLRGERRATNRLSHGTAAIPDCYFKSGYGRFLSYHFQLITHGLTAIG